ALGQSKLVKPPERKLQNGDRAPGIQESDTHSGRTSGGGARMAYSFDLQGHRGARGLKPENTLPSFETALDLMVSSIETDVHLTKDVVAVLCHDDTLTPLHARVLPGAVVPQPMFYPKISGLALKQVRSYLVDLNPDPNMLGRQSSGPTPVAQLFSRER